MITTIQKLLETHGSYEKLIAFMESDAFQLKKEYDEMRQYTTDLDTRINSEPNTEDWFEDI